MCASHGVVFYVRETHGRNESEAIGHLLAGWSQAGSPKLSSRGALPARLVRGLGSLSGGPGTTSERRSKSAHVGTRKMVNYA